MKQMPGGFKNCSQKTHGKVSLSVIKKCNKVKLLTYFACLLGTDKPLVDIIRFYTFQAILVKQIFMGIGNAFKVILLSLTKLLTSNKCMNELKSMFYLDHT